MKRFTILIFIMVFTLFLFGCGSNPESKTLIKALTENDDPSLYLKILETKIEDNQIYCRIQNISKYDLNKTTYKVYLLDSSGNRIGEEFLNFSDIKPNYIEETTTTIFNPIPEWSGEIETEFFISFIHNPNN